MQFRILFEMIEKPDNIRYNYRKDKRGVGIIEQQSGQAKIDITAACDKDAR